MNVRELKADMVRKGISTEELAHYTGIKRSTLFRRLNMPDRFTLSEIIKISEALELSPSRINEIFFNQLCPKRHKILNY